MMIWTTASQQPLAFLPEELGDNSLSSVCGFACFSPCVSLCLFLSPSYLTLTVHTNCAWLLEMPVTAGFLCWAE